MRNVLSAALAATLAGCSTAPAEWRAETVPVVVVHSQLKPNPSHCPQLDPSIASESTRVTALEASRSGGIDGLAAALMRSEMEKNARLRQVWVAHQKCFRSRQ
jgi:hypothetical protein